ncbi:hypothetical protein DFH07DRAFT_945119, partial [Mycena maculata]
MTMVHSATWRQLTPRWRQTSVKVVLWGVKVAAFWRQIGGDLALIPVWLASVFWNIPNATAIGGTGSSNALKAAVENNFGYLYNDNGTTSNIYSLSSRHCDKSDADFGIDLSWWRLCGVKVAALASFSPYSKFKTGTEHQTSRRISLFRSRFWSDAHWLSVFSITAAIVDGIPDVHIFPDIQKVASLPYNCKGFSVLYLFFAETVNVLCVIGIVYEPLIVRYGSPQALVTSPILLPADAISIVAVSTPIQLFTAWRISIITGSVALPLLVSVLSAASLGGGVLVTAFVTIRNQFQEFQSFSAEIIFWLTSSALCDVMIAVILTYSLWTRKTGFTAMDGQINRIIRLTVQTGAITAVAALTDLILFLSFPGTTLQFITDFPLSKLYTICLLSTLNARTRGKAEDAEQRPPNVLFKETGLTPVQSLTATQKQNTFKPNPNLTFLVRNRWILWWFRHVWGICDLCFQTRGLRTSLNWIRGNMSGSEFHWTCKSLGLCGILVRCLAWYCISKMYVLPTCYRRMYCCEVYKDYIS